MRQTAAVIPEPDELASLRQSIIDDTDRRRAALDADPTAPVQHCPGWDVAELVRHHGEVLRWADEIVRTGAEAVRDVPSPAEPAALARWYHDGATDLVAALEATDPARPCWTFGRPPAVTWFWTRRQALEAAVHRWDGQNAIGATEAVDPRLCAAGLDEVVDVLYPRQVDLGRIAPLPGLLELRLTDLDRTWRLGPAEGAPFATVTGAAEAIFLLMWRRTDLLDPRLTVAADSAAQATIAATRFAP